MKFLRHWQTLLVLALPQLPAHADQNGNLIMTPTDCGMSAFTALDFICETLGSGLCSTTANSCSNASQEIFTGLNIELASPAKFLPWTGFGGMGEIYQSAGVCLLKDLDKKSITSEAKASVAIGNASIKQQILFSGWDPASRTVSAYQRNKVCAPAIGCLDIATQKFSLKAVSTNKTGSGEKAGSYDIYKTTALQLDAEALMQGMKVTIPAINVNTPYGQVSAKPEFDFGRALGFIQAPFDGNKTAGINTVFGLTKYTDLYGRVPGMKLSQTYPIKPLPTMGGEDKTKIGYVSQIGLGSRDANIKSSPWKPTAGEAWPTGRPDANVGQARSILEKTPNAYLGANVKIAYDPIGMLPDWIRNSSFINIAFSIFAQPTVGAGFTSQFDINSNEAAKWDGTMASQTVPDLRPNHLDQLKGLSMYGGTSASALFALLSGVDLTLKLHIPLPFPFDDIEATLIDLHPRATLAEATSNGYGTSVPAANASSQASKIVATNNFFQSYNTLLGPKDGLKHIQACLATPKKDAPAPADPVYEPGNPQDLIEGILYPCNICVGMNDYSYTALGKVNTIKGFLELYFPADQSTRPGSTQWACDKVYESGCYDMCSYDVTTNHLTVVKTAKEMLATGELKGAGGRPMRCN